MLTFRVLQAPAEQTKMSHRLNLSLTLSKTCWQPSNVRKPAVMVRGAGPAVAITLAALARLSAEEETITVCAPEWASSSAISRPMPRPVDLGR